MSFFDERFRDALNLCGKISGRQTDKMKAGIYSAMIDGNVVENLSFNYDRNESDIACYDESELKEIFKKLGISQISLVNPVNSEITSEIKEIAEGNDVTQLFLWLVLLLFLIEIAVIKLTK